MAAAEQIPWDKPASEFWRVVFTRDYWTHRELDLPRGVAELARATGIYEGTLRSWVKQRRLPPVAKAVLLANECGVTPEELEHYYPDVEFGYRDKRVIRKRRTRTDLALIS